MTETLTPNIRPANDPDSRIYLECMNELNERLKTVMWLSYGESIYKRTAQWVMETQMLQLRICLELLALSTMVANQERYATVRTSFETDWKARKMLEVLEKINPDFYPTPVYLREHGSGPTGKDRAAYEVVKDGHLTREDFIFLYEASSAVVHGRNPFHPRTSVEIKYDFPVWTSRIRKLLEIHMLHFVDDRRWLVYVPEAGRIQVFTVIGDPSIR